MSSERYIGLLSGTSMDGVDAALVDLSGSRMRLLATHSAAFPPDLRDALLLLIEGHVTLTQIAAADVRLGHLFAAAATALLEVAACAPRDVRAIGSHGQTVWHQPEGETPTSLQLGDANIIAERTGITTVADFRRRDLAAGGQGAPLATAFHAAALRGRGEDRAVLNVGGIANLSTLPADPAAQVLGFDTGPGNVLMDGWIRRHLGRNRDDDGAWGASGQVNDALLQGLLADGYFSRPPPKSSGREYFHLGWLERAVAATGRAIAPQDVQATLCELTAVSVARAVKKYLPGARRLLVCGGGAHNRALMNRLRRHLPGCTVSDTRAVGLDPDWMEAMAFAWLAQQHLNGRAGNLPSVTGAAHPAILGAVYPGDSAEG
ncbi:MAG TPA: anhydro-N-acetylmuramic acid kinase [Gammaproteobacteria bacterium]|nr:anhydro-N-acetylmuramic acid kinase [Gammaproteobacteria bacterium]